MVTGALNTTQRFIRKFEEITIDDIPLVGESFATEIFVSCPNT